MLGRGGVLQAARDVAQREVLRVVDAREEARREKARHDEADAYSVGAHGRRRVSPPVGLRRREQELAGFYRRARSG